MKLIWIHLAAIAILAGFAFGQADSLNMTLVDRWLYYTDESGVNIDLVDNYVIAGTKGHVFFFELSSSGELTLLDSLLVPMPSWPPTFPWLGDIAHKDSVIYFHKGNPVEDETAVVIYLMINPGVLDSITSFSFDRFTETIQISDTLLYLYDYAYSDFYVFNISNPTSPNLVVQGDFSRDLNFYSFWGEYPYLYHGGKRVGGTEPESWYRGYFQIMDVSDPDTQFICYSAFSEYGSFYNQSCFFSMAKKDSLLYAGGYNRYVEVYNVAEDGSDAPFVSSWGDSTSYDYPNDFVICGNYLYSCGSTHLRIFDISDPLYIENIAYYVNYDYTPGYPSPTYFYLCLKDSFIITIGRIYPENTLTVEVFKSPFFSMSNYEEVSLPNFQELTAYPNPFNAACKINIPAGFTAAIYDIHGRQVHSLSCGFSVWNADGQPSGVYLVQARKGDVVMEKRVVLVR